MSASNILGSVFFLMAAALLTWGVRTNQIRKAGLSEVPDSTFWKVLRMFTIRPARAAWVWSGDHTWTRWIAALSLLTGGGWYALPDRGEVLKSFPEVQGSGAIIYRIKLFEGLKHQRIVLLDTLAVQIPAEVLKKHKKKQPSIVIKVSNGALYEYNLRGEATVKRTYTKLFVNKEEGERPHREDRMKMHKYRGGKIARSHQSGIREDSEIEWHGGPPYAIEVYTKPAGLGLINSGSIRYRVVDQESIGETGEN